MSMTIMFIFPIYSEAPGLPSVVSPSPFKTPNSVHVSWRVLLRFSFGFAFGPCSIKFVILSSIICCTCMNNSCLKNGCVG